MIRRSVGIAVPMSPTMHHFPATSRMQALYIGGFVLTYELGVAQRKKKGFLAKMSPFGKK